MLGHGEYYFYICYIHYDLGRLSLSVLTNAFLSLLQTWVCFSFYYFILYVIAAAKHLRSLVISVIVTVWKTKIHFHSFIVFQMAKVLFTQICHDILFASLFLKILWALNNLESTMILVTFESIYIQNSFNGRRYSVIAFANHSYTLKGCIKDEER